MAPTIVSEVAKEESIPFAPKSKKNKVVAKEEVIMTEVETPKTEVVEKKTMSVSELYAELESELVLKGSITNTGITKRIREIVDSIFAATQKDKLLLAAVVRIVESECDRKKMYNLVRSVANAKQGKYELKTIDGKAFIVLRE